MQEKSADLCSSPERLERLRVETQATWAEVAEVLGLSQSMIYQVKSGARQLSTKAEHRLAVAERKAGLAPPVATSINNATSKDSAWESFSKASTGEQLQLLERDRGLWRFWFEMRNSIVLQTAKEIAAQAKEIAALAIAVEKDPSDKRLRAKLKAVSKEHAKTGETLENLVEEQMDSLIQISSQIGKKD